MEFRFPNLGFRIFSIHAILCFFEEKYANLIDRTFFELMELYCNFEQKEILPETPEGIASWTRWETEFNIAVTSCLVAVSSFSPGVVCSLLLALPALDSSDKSDWIWSRFWSAPDDREDDPPGNQLGIVRLDRRRFDARSVTSANLFLMGWFSYLNWFFKNFKIII